MSSKSLQHHKVIKSSTGWSTKRRKLYFIQFREICPWEMFVKFNCVPLSLPEALFLVNQYWSKPLSNCVSCVTDHCEYNRHPKEIGFREKYLGPKHISTVLVHGFIFSHLLVPKIWRHKSDVFLQCVLGSLGSLWSVRGKLIIC